VEKEPPTDCSTMLSPSAVEMWNGGSAGGGPRSMTVSSTVAEGAESAVAAPRRVVDSSMAAISVKAGCHKCTRVPIDTDNRPQRAGAGEGQTTHPPPRKCNGQGV
jgi:hypothetical protein